MRESILLFHISDKEVKKKVERALLPLRVRLRHITLKDYSQPLGVLAGLPDMTPSEEIYEGNTKRSTNPKILIIYHFFPMLQHSYL